MGRCPFALDSPVGYGPGTYSGGPWRVVWHKTQGATLAGALGVYRQHRVAPHLTIDENGDVHQHFDTDGSAYALVNAAGGVETNREQAVQIEVVGFIGHTMAPAQLRACVAVTAWLEQTYPIPAVWPLGRPDGTDPRDATVWVRDAGHYGHSQVPENNHTDPAWTDDEWAVLSWAAAPAPPAGPPTPAPVPATTLEVDDMVKHSQFVPFPGGRLDGAGRGWAWLPVPFVAIDNVIGQGANPLPVDQGGDGRYFDHVGVDGQPHHNGNVDGSIISFTGKPNQEGGVFVTWTQAA